MQAELTLISKFIFDLHLNFFEFRLYLFDVLTTFNGSYTPVGLSRDDDRTPHHPNLTRTAEWILNQISADL
jgi:hypothetical protein